jgi:hypothetical protein
MWKVVQTACCVLTLWASTAVLYAQVIRRGDCQVNAEIWQVPACALESRGTRIYISPVYLPLYFSSAGTPYNGEGAEGMGLAWTRLPQGDWAYFDRTGRIAVRYVATMDNGPSEFYHGLVRVTRQRKWGLADSQGRAVVPMTYDGMMDFQEGKGWLACIGCHIKYERDREYSWFDGGRWIWLDQRGSPSRPGDQPHPPVTP